MADNRAVVYVERGTVAVQPLAYPRLRLAPGPGVPPGNAGRDCPHGAVLRVLATNICGSDLHILRGREDPPPGLVLGHEITGQVVETGPAVEFTSVGDVVSVPFNVACGSCSMCRRGETGCCLRVNPDGAGSAYGCAGLGGWRGGQAGYVMVPYADWNLLPFPDREQALEKIVDLAMLSDIFPAGLHGCRMARVAAGSSVYIAGAGAVGLAAATAAFLLGAATVVVGDLNPGRLAQARSFGCATVDVSAGDVRQQLRELTGEPEVDCAVDAVGFEARGDLAGAGAPAPAAVINTLIEVTRAGGAIGLVGLYVMRDVLAADEGASHGRLPLDLGLAWAKSLTIATGSTPVARYNRWLLAAILAGRVSIARNVNARVVPLEQAPEAYRALDQGAACKFVLDPTGALAGRT